MRNIPIIAADGARKRIKYPKLFWIWIFISPGLACMIMMFLLSYFGFLNFENTVYNCSIIVEDGDMMVIYIDDIPEEELHGPRGIIQDSNCSAMSDYKILRTLNQSPSGISWSNNW